MLREQQSARLDPAADRCMSIIESGETRRRRGSCRFRGVDGERSALEVVWDPDVGDGVRAAAGPQGTRAVPLDPWLVDELDGFIARYEVAGDAGRPTRCSRGCSPSATPR